MNARQERFVAEYLVDLNATQAAIRAGYSEATAKQQGSRLLLTNVDVQQAVAAAQRVTFERVQVSAEDISRRAWLIAQEDKPDRVSALSLLARRHPEFSEKHDINANVRLQALSVVANMTEEQLLALAGEPITTSSKTGDNGHELRNSSSAQSLALHNGEA